MRRHQLDPDTLTCTHCLGTAEWFAAFPVETPCRDKHQTHALVEIWRAGYAKGYDAGATAGQLEGLLFLVGKMKDAGHLSPDFDPLAPAPPAAHDSAPLPTGGS